MNEISKSKELANLVRMVRQHLNKSPYTEISVMDSSSYLMADKLRELESRLDRLEARFQKSGVFFNEGTIIKDEYGQYRMVRGQK